MPSQWWVKLTKFSFVVRLPNWRYTQHELNMELLNNSVDSSRPLQLVSIALQPTCTSRPRFALYTIHPHTTVWPSCTTRNCRQRPCVVCTSCSAYVPPLYPTTNKEIPNDLRFCVCVFRHVARHFAVGFEGLWIVQIATGLENIHASEDYLIMPSIRRYLIIMQCIM